MNRRKLLKSIMAVGILAVLPKTVSAKTSKYPLRFNRRMKKAIRLKQMDRFVKLYVNQKIRYANYIDN